MQCASRVDHRRQLALDDRLGLALPRAAASVSPTQTIGVTPCASAALALSATSWSVSPWSCAALGVADDHVATAELGQHRGRHLAGVGALRRAPSSPARPSASVAAGAGDRDLRQVRRTGTHTATSATHGRAARRCRQQRVVGGVAAVHLPVARRPAWRLGTHVAAFTRSARSCRCAALDSISAWACGRLRGAGTRCGSPA